MFGKFVDMPGHGFAFAGEIIVYRATKTRMRDVVRAVSWCWHISAKQFVFALCTRFNLTQAARDREFDRLIIACLEMQEWYELIAAPIAAKEDAVAKEIERAGDVPPVAFRHHEQDLVCHASANAAEKNYV
ncbi:MAG: hypothetical protein WDM89_18030 [Rhizomicrobium sp.]